MTTTDSQAAAIHAAGEQISAAIRDGAQAIVFAIKAHANCRAGAWEEGVDGFKAAERAVSSLNGKPSRLPKLPKKG